MTPTKALRLECKWCMGMAKAAKCESEVCKLKDKSLSSLKCIKLHCLDCVVTKKEVKECTGKLLSEDRLCYLHPYRFGHNPRQKGIGNPRFTKKPQRNEMVLASKNDAELVGSSLGL